MRTSVFLNNLFFIFVLVVACACVLGTSTLASAGDITAQNSSAGDMFTLGFIENEHLRLFTPTEQDYANGYVYMEVLGGLITGIGLGGSKCFTAGTQIVVGAEYDANDVFVQYVTVNIEDIQVGDLVYSYDTITGEVTQKEVTAVFVRESDHINYLTIADEYGRIQVIETTDAHPFWVVTDEPNLERAARSVVDENGVILYHENIETGLNGFWVEAKDLREGDVFLGANGELSTLVVIERVVFPDGIKVYNFTVDGNHDYFVIAQTGDYGQMCILVHNSCVQDYSDWHKGSFESPEASLNWHYNKHGKEVGAKNVNEYYEMAKNARDSVIGKNGKAISGFTDNVFAYTIGGNKYIYVARDILNPTAIPRIISFGLIK